MPNIKCIIESCTNRNYPRGAKKSFHGAKKSFHRLPEEGTQLRQQWLDALGLKPEEFKREGKVNYFICSDHFSNYDYLSKGAQKWILERNAVPSQNLPQGSLAKPPEKRSAIQMAMDEVKDIVARINNQPTDHSRDPIAQKMCFIWTSFIQQVLNI